MTKLRNRKPTVAALALAKTAAANYSQDLRRFLVRRLHSSQGVQDLAQEVYLRMLRVEDAESIRDSRAYLYTIAAHVVHEFKLQARREQVTFDSDLLAQRAEHPEELPPEQLAERLSTQRQLEGVLAQLHPTCRAVFLLQKQAGMSYAEVAKALNLSIHTVQKYVFRALAMLRAADWER